MTESPFDSLTDHKKRNVIAMFEDMVTDRPLINFMRVMETKFTIQKPGVPNTGPLSYGNGGTRFGPVEFTGSEEPHFGVIYCAFDLGAACYEKIIRNRFDLEPARVLTPENYMIHSGQAFKYSAVTYSSNSGQKLALLDLTEGNATSYGVPTDVIRSSNQCIGRHFSEFVWHNMPAVDGLLYSSRFTEILCVAVYDRAFTKIQFDRPMPLSLSTLQSTLTPWKVQVL